jgi:1,4-alpha-glucan branching enzyme
MAQKQIHQPANEPAPGTRFLFHAPEAAAVYLAGTFNEWNPRSTPMVKNAEGVWNIDIPLQTGRYEYKFVVDDQWHCEPDQEQETASLPRCECAPNPFGTFNYILVVAEEDQEYPRT